MNFTCLTCNEEIITSYPKCNACSAADAVADIRAAVQSRLDELNSLTRMILMGEAYKGEIRAYIHVLEILEKI